MTATILNAERLLRKLQAMPSKVKEAIRQAMADQADEIVAMMRRLAPDHIRPTIAWRWGKRAPAGSMSVATVGGKGDLTITIYAKEWTAHWFEFGTAERFHETGHPTGKITAQPFFYVSWRANRKSARAKIRAALRKAAKEVAAS